VGLVRNAALVLGDRRVAQAVPALGRRLADVEEDPVVRAAAAWALGRIGTAEAVEILRQNQRAADALVREAVARALENPETDKGHQGTGQAC
jgi:epoxyqueuosine reductase